ncbi:MAG: FAD-dependent oxidoreductase [Cytophagales bacterium]|nr:FAD-dependent oxidoreductase [Cytophagales bacterium]
MNSLSPQPRKVAIIGSGIAGLSAAYALRNSAQVTLFEAGAYFGGHANTVEIQLDGKAFGVDTGFLVYNEKTYPGLIQLFKALEVTVAPSDMGFSVQVFDRAKRREWAGNSLQSVFAQRRQWCNLRHWRMLFDIVRFNRIATALAIKEDAAWPNVQTVEDFLREHSFGSAFIEDYFLPMIACIWSCPVSQMKAYPIRALLRFCHNHGLLQLTRRPQWLTVVGGSKNYVQRIVASTPDARLQTKVVRLGRSSEGVQQVFTENNPKPEHFSAVILACHPDQSLQILGGEASVQEKNILSKIRYQTNEAVLHTDTSVMPHNRTAWAAWNYERHAPHPAANPSEVNQVCLHYWLNKLQPLPTDTPIFVSLNPLRQPDPAKVLQRIQYDHPIFDSVALKAQSELAQLQGKNRTWFAGAWCHYGFHEDGFQAGLAAAQGVLQS